MKRFMSIANLLKTFNINYTQAFVLRTLVKGELEIEDTEFMRALFPKTFDWIDSCYHNPLYYNCHTDEINLEALNEILEGYGIESIRKGSSWVSHYWQDTRFLYVNMGDTYAPTILYDTRKDKYIVSDFGTVVETNNL